VVSLPSAICDSLRDTAIEAIRSKVGTDVAFLPRLLLPSAEEMTAAVFAACETARGEELLDQIHAEPPPGVPATKWRDFQDASRELARSHARRASPALSEGARDRVVRARAEARLPVRSRPATPDAAALPPHSAFVHLHPTLGVSEAAPGFLSAVWLARTPAGLQHGRTALGRVDTAAIERIIRELSGSDASSRPAAERPALVETLRRALAEVAGPLRDTFTPLGVRRLIISAAPPLDLAPLHAAPTGRTPDSPVLADVFDEVVYAPSLRVLAASGRQRVRRPGRPLLVMPGPNGLPGATAELALLRAVYPQADVLEHEQATPSAVVERSRHATRLHIACHGHVADDRWLNGLEMAGSEVLTVADILADGDLRGVDVAVLNACHTSVHRSHGPLVQTPRGLDAALLACGASVVISTLWEVRDDTAVVFAGVLHASMAAGTGAAVAYKRACALLRGTLSPDDPSMAEARELLDREYPRWRRVVERGRARGVWTWAAFRMAGSSWEAR
jgi:hypothetical protein